MTEGLWCECRIPLTWREIAAGDLSLPDKLRQASLLLTALNDMESMHELEHASAENRRLERIESKLDLALYLLARNLGPTLTAEPRLVRLSPEGIEWEDENPPHAERHLVLSIRPSDALPLSLELPAVAQAPSGGLARAQLASVSEPLNDALYQFVFRRHRQAIRARMG